MVNLKYLSAVACAVLLIVFTTSTSWAQSVSSAQVSGVVRDSSGGSLPGADVTITKVDTGAARSVVTGVDGASYDMAVPARKRQLVSVGVAAYIEKVAAVIRRHDPHGLVTMGFFAPKFPNPTAIGGDWYVDTLTRSFPERTLVAAE